MTLPLFRVSPLSSWGALHSLTSLGHTARPRTRPLGPLSEAEMSLGLLACSPDQSRAWVSLEHSGGSWVPCAVWGWHQALSRHEWPVGFIDLWPAQIFIILWSRLLDPLPTPTPLSAPLLPSGVVCPHTEREPIQGSGG